MLSLYVKVQCPFTLYESKKVQDVFLSYHEKETYKSPFRCELERENMGKKKDRDID